MTGIDVAALKKYIIQFPLTRVMTLPPIVHFLNNLNDPKVFRSLATLRELYVAAAPLGPSLQTEFENKLRAAGRAAGVKHEVKVVQIWGMTELSAVVSRFP